MTEWQNDRMTDRTKTICPPIFDLGGIKKRIVAIQSNQTMLNKIKQIIQYEIITIDSRKCNNVLKF